MTEKDPKTAVAEPVPPIHDDPYDPPSSPTTEPVGGSPIIEKPPFDGGDDDKR